MGISNNHPSFIGTGAVDGEHDEEDQADVVERIADQITHDAEEDALPVLEEVDQHVMMLTRDVERRAFDYVVVLNEMGRMERDAEDAGYYVPTEPHHRARLYDISRAAARVARGEPEIDPAEFQDDTILVDEDDDEDDDEEHMFPTQEEWHAEIERELFAGIGDQ
jgi:hypothetical protein